MLTRLQNRLKRLHPLAIGGAWFFVIISLLHLVWVIGVKLPDPAGLTELYQSSIVSQGGEQTYHAWGLTYDGSFGLIQAMFQALIILTAMFFTSLRFRRPILLRLRRVGHVILVIWVAWWAMNLIRLAGLDHQFESFMQASLLTILTGCTGYRAKCGWQLNEKAQDLIANETLLAPEQIESSGRVDEIHPDRPHGWCDRFQRFVLRFKGSNTNDARERLRKLADRAQPVVKKTVQDARVVAAEAGSRARPVLDSIRRRTRRLAARVTDYLRSHGVIAERGKSTASG